MTSKFVLSLSQRREGKDWLRLVADVGGKASAQAVETKPSDWSVKSPGGRQDCLGLPSLSLILTPAEAPGFSGTDCQI